MPEFEKARQAPWHRDVVRALLDHAELDANAAGRALELGCGAGGAVDALPSRGCAAFALDLARAMVRAVHDRTGIPAVVGDAQRLPFRAAAFSAVIGAFYFQLVPDRLLALREARRVLRPGGVHALAVQAEDWTLDQATADAEELGLAGPERERLLRCANRFPGTWRGSDAAVTQLFRDAGYGRVSVARHTLRGVILAAGWAP